MNVANLSDEPFIYLLGDQREPIQVEVIQTAPKNVHAAAGAACAHDTRIKGESVCGAILCVSAGPSGIDFPGCAETHTALGGAGPPKHKTKTFCVSNAAGGPGPCGCAAAPQARFFFSEIRSLKIRP